MKHLQHFVAAVGVILLSGALNTVSANLTLLSPEDFAGTGLGAVNTILTIQSPGATTTEQGCVGRSTIGCSAGSINAAGDVIGGLQGGNELTGASQTLTRTIGALGLTTAANLRVVFNVAEPPPDAGITLVSLNLGIYDGTTGALLFNASLPAPLVITGTDTGIGNSGFVFGLTALEATGAQGSFAPGNRIGLSARAAGATGGPETFFVANTGTPVPGVPEPASLLLLGSGLAGLGFWRWKKN